MSRLEVEALIKARTLPYASSEHADDKVSDYNPR
jgi:hypothetical protein